MNVVQEPGKRSQLWRMSGSGMLCHEGSSPPQNKPAQPRPLDSSLVLDIAGLAAVTDNRCVLSGTFSCWRRSLHAFFSLQLRAFEAEEARLSPQHHPDLELQLGHAHLWASPPGGSGGSSSGFRRLS